MKSLLKSNKLFIISIILFISSSSLIVLSINNIIDFKTIEQLIDFIEIFI